jgi:chromatin assembly factor 1 subunit B
MHAEAIEIAWHDEASIWSVDCASSGNRLVTAGGDKVARVWRFVENLHSALAVVSKVPEKTCVKDSSNSKVPKVKAPPSDPQGKCSRKIVVEWLCDLSAHTTTVNVARFSPDGERIATAADQGEIVLWYLGGPLDDDRDDRPRERWTQAHVVRGHSFDVLDLSWSPDGKSLASASVDNSIRIWDTTNPKRLPATITHHDSLVQGVAFDPRSRFIASLGSDRALAVYSLATSKSVASLVSTATDPKSYYFASDTKCSTVFRRLAWSPDGSFLACPSGLEVPNLTPCVYSIQIFARDGWASPALQCTGLTKIPTAVAFCPILYRREISTAFADRHSETPRQDLYHLPYRLIFAVACGDAVLIYDTESCSRPVAYLAGVHYAEITDLSWGPDGNALFASSTDGCISIVAFEDGELGTALPSENMPAWMQQSPNMQSEGQILSSSLTLEPVTPVNSGCRGASLEKASSRPNHPGDADTDSVMKSPVDHEDGVREVVVVIPRRKQTAGPESSRALTLEGDPARKRLKLDEL